MLLPAPLPLPPLRPPLPSACRLGPAAPPRERHSIMAQCWRPAEARDLPATAGKEGQDTPLPERRGAVPQRLPCALVEGLAHMLLVEGLASKVSAPPVRGDVGSELRGFATQCLASAPPAQPPPGTGVAAPEREIALLLVNCGTEALPAFAELAGRCKVSLEEQPELALSDGTVPDALAASSASAATSFTAAAASVAAEVGDPEEGEECDARCPLLCVSCTFLVKTASMSS